MHWLNIPGALPVYLEASSPELSQLLSSVNSKVLLLRHLTPEQEKLVYKPANRSKLEQEPVEITLGDVTLTLQHIDVNKDVPSYRKQLLKILHTSKTPEDWENVIRVLEGYNNAGIHLRSETLAMAVRRLDDAGMHHLILKAIQRAEATGLRLRDPDLIFMVMRSVRDRAWRNDWDKDELKKALRMAEQIVELMDDPVHQGKPSADGPDYRTHPAVVALPLEMAAELAYRHDGPSDAVKKYTPRFMNALKQHDFMAVSSSISTPPPIHSTNLTPSPDRNHRARLPRCPTLLRLPHQIRSSERSPQHTKQGGGPRPRLERPLRLTHRSGRRDAHG